jgi:hypothetical protein
MYFCVVRAAHEVLLVVCNEPTSISDTYSLIKLLNRDFGMDRFRVLVNMAIKLCGQRMPECVIRRSATPAPITQFTLDAEGISQRSDESLAALPVGSPGYVQVHQKRHT